MRSRCPYASFIRPYKVESHPFGCLFRGYMRNHCLGLQDPTHKRCINLSFLYPSLPPVVWMCVCVCVCLSLSLSLPPSLFLSLCFSLSSLSVCLSVCVFRMVARAADVTGGGGLVSDLRVLSLLIRIAGSSASFGLASACDAIGIAQVRFDLI